MKISRYCSLMHTYTLSIVMVVVVGFHHFTNSFFFHSFTLNNLAVDALIVVIIFSPPDFWSVHTVQCAVMKSWSLIFFGSSFFFLKLKLMKSSEWLVSNQKQSHDRISCENHRFSGRKLTRKTNTDFLFGFTQIKLNFIFFFQRIKFSFVQNFDKQLKWNCQCDLIVSEWLCKSNVNFIDGKWKFCRIENFLSKLHSLVINSDK